MLRREFKIADPEGFHARPATMVANAAVKHRCSILMSYNDCEVSVKSLLGLMALGMPYGAHFTVTCSGDGEEEAMKAITDIMISEKVIDRPEE